MASNFEKKYHYREIENTCETCADVEDDWIYDGAGGRPIHIVQIFNCRHKERNKREQASVNMSGVCDEWEKQK